MYDKCRADGLGAGNSKLWSNIRRLVENQMEKMENEIEATIVGAC